jgi:putative ABC transport system substrate-binding protein
MKRRDFIMSAGGAALGWPLAAHAQQPDRVRRIGFLRASQPPAWEFDALQRALAENGYVPGRNLVVVRPGAMGMRTDFPSSPGR